MGSRLLNDGKWVPFGVGRAKSCACYCMSHCGGKLTVRAGAAGYRQTFTHVHIFLKFSQ